MMCICTYKITLDDNKVDDLCLLSNPIIRLKGQDVKAKSRWVFTTQWQ